MPRERQDLPAGHWPRRPRLSAPPSSACLHSPERRIGMFISRPGRTCPDGNAGGGSGWCRPPAPHDSRLTSGPAFAISRVMRILHEETRHGEGGVDRLGRDGLPDGGAYPQEGRARPHRLQPQRRQGRGLGQGVRRQDRADAGRRRQGRRTSCSAASATTTTCARSRSAPRAPSSRVRKGAVFIDNTTASANIARELYAAAKAKGFDFLDAPVSGGQAGAVERRADRDDRRRPGALRQGQAGDRQLRPHGHADRARGRRPAHQDGQPDHRRHHRAGRRPRASPSRRRPASTSPR